MMPPPHKKKSLFIGQAENEEAAMRGALMCLTNGHSNNQTVPFRSSLLCLVAGTRLTAAVRNQENWQHRFIQKQFCLSVSLY